MTPNATISNFESTMFDQDRFHNELAMRLGYQRIVNDKRVMISVEDSDDPLVTLKIDGGDDIRFKASEELENVESIPEIHDEIKQIGNAVHDAYLKSTSKSFACYNG